jgi:hypothetical protein
MRGQNHRGKRRNNRGKKSDVESSEMRRQKIRFRAVKGNDIRNRQEMTEERSGKER